MAGLRRSQALGIALSIALIYFLFFAGSDTTDFRRTTEESLSRRRGILRGDLSDADLTAQTNRELQMILDQQNAGLEPTAAQAGGRKSQSQATSVPFDEDDASVAGRISIPKSKEKPKYPVDGTAAHGLDSGGEEVAFNGNKIEKAKDEGEDAAREEFHNILKKSPIIIFSKSYCPYSKRAKALLLQTYTISPAPYVVELDLMTTIAPKSHGRDGDDDDEDAPAATLGRKLQDLLASLTGRRTVPNIMINAKSLGGSDDIARMHEEGTLEEEIKRMGGNRIVSVQKTHKDED